MATKSIEERAEERYPIYGWMRNLTVDAVKYSRKVFIEIATEQDRIARAEERERCIQMAQEAHCRLCVINNRCELIENGTIGVDTWNRLRCFNRVNIRRAMKGGEGC